MTPGLQRTDITRVHGLIAPYVRRTPTLTVNGSDVLRAERLVFASRPLTDPVSIQESRDMFRYVSGNPDLVVGVAS